MSWTPERRNLTGSARQNQAGTATSEINGYKNQGWWSSNTTNSNSNTNYETGSSESHVLVRAYFTFDITGINVMCASSTAYLSIPSGFGSVYGGYGGPDPVQLSLYDVSTDPITLSHKVNNPNLTIYNDLGSGTLYGSSWQSTSASGTTFTPGLNRAGVSAILAARQGQQQYFSIGTAITNPLITSSYQYSYAFLFGFTGSSPVTLTVISPGVCKA